MIRRLSLLSSLFCAVAACGDGGSGDDGGADGSAGDSCGETGAGNLSGSVRGEELGPVQAAWYGQLGPDAYVIVVDEDQVTCGQQSAGEHLVLAFCAPVTAGTVPIVPEASFPDGGCADDPVAMAFVEDEGGADLDESAGGSVTIDAVGACSTGSFSVTFAGGDSIEGRFSAIGCDTVMP